MPAPTTVNIQWNAGTGTWTSNTPNAVISKSDGITFNVAFPNTKNGVRICFNNSDVFGTNYLEYTTQGNHNPPVTGSVGQSSTYHLQDSGTTCAPITPAADPYDVTIGSSAGDAGY